MIQYFTADGVSRRVGHQTPSKVQVSLQQRLGHDAGQEETLWRVRGGLAPETGIERIRDAFHLSHFKARIHWGGIKFARCVVLFFWTNVCNSTASCFFINFYSCTSSFSLKKVHPVLLRRANSSWLPQYLVSEIILYHLSFTNPSILIFDYRNW